MPKIKETCCEEETLLKEIRGLAWCGVYAAREDASDAAEAACSAIVDRILAWQEGKEQPKATANQGSVPK